MKIRCDQCGKKIGIDDAFSGGVCRCPYCNAITYVPRDANAVGGSRPAAPGVRPVAPGARPAAPGGSGAAAGVAEVPMADPVRTRALLGIIALAALVGILIVALVLFWPFGGDDDEGQSGPEKAKAEAEEHYRQQEERAAKLSRPNVAGEELTLPVIYCVDGNMSPLDSALEAIGKSVAVLSPEQEYNVIVWSGGRYRRLSKDWIAGGKDAAEKDAAKDKLAAFVENCLIGPLPEAGDALAVAAAAGPKQIVVFASQSTGAVSNIAEACKGKITVIGVLIEAATLGATAEAAESMKALAEETGGTFLSFTPDELSQALAVDGQ